MAADQFDAIIVGGGHKGCEAAAGAVSADRQRGGIPANGACVFGSPRENVRNIFGRVRELVLRGEAVIDCERQLAQGSSSAINCHHFSR